MIEEEAWRERYRHPVAWDIAFPPRSMVDLFDATAQRDADRPAIDFMGRRYRYGELADGVRRVATGLARLGIGRGDRVGLFLPNVPHYVAAYHGALRLGATVVNFSPLYTVDELCHQVEDSGTRVLFTLTAAQLLPTALAVLEKSGLERIVVGSVAGALPPGKSWLYRMFKRGEAVARPDDPRVTAFSALIDNAGDAPAAAIDPVRDVALLQYTGGTTGTPKGAMLTHANIAANAQQVAAIDPHRDATDRILGVLPLFHVFANTCVMNRTIVTGGEMVLLPRFEAGQALAAIARTRPTALPGVPTMYQALLDRPDLAKTDFSSLRVCIAGGAPLAAELKTRWEAATGSTLVEGYGLSESSGVLSANPYEGAQKAGTIGQPIPGTRLRLVDKEDASRAAPAGEPGEIVAAGPQIMAGYWNRPEADETTFVTDDAGTRWLRTGDVGQIDADGFVTIVDRLKDMIVTGGENVFCSEVENAIARHPAVAECAVVGLPHDLWGEAVHAVVVLKPGGQASAAELIAHCGGVLSNYKRPKTIEIANEPMPLSGVGKVMKNILRERCLANRLQVAAHS